MRPITTTPELEAACERLARASHLAVDTEFIRDRTYYAQLCLVQVASADEHVLLDPLALQDLSPLRRLLVTPSIVKVFHAGRHDLEILHDIWGEVPEPIFDTQLAATLLGLPSQTSYGRLVGDLLGVQLEKAGTLTDWSRRPLTDEQLAYAADDVIHLERLYLHMLGLLEEKGRTRWLDAEHAALADPATYRIDPDESWRQVKSGSTLRGLQRAALRHLAAWRERQARERNIPRRWVLPDESLLEIARKRPRKMDELRVIRGVQPALLDRWGDDLLTLVAKAEIGGEAEPARERDGARLGVSGEAIADLLTCLVRLRAQERGIAATQLATRAHVEAVAAEGELSDAPVLQGWRREVVGDDLLALREGRLRLRVQAGAVTVEPVESPVERG